MAPHLGLSRSEVDEVEREGGAEKEKRQKILDSWKGKFAFKAKYIVLIEALLKIGRADQAEQLCRLLVPQQSKEGTILALVPPALLIMLSNCWSGSGILLVEA